MHTHPLSRWMQLPGLEEWCTGRIPSTHAPCPANILHSCTGRCHFKDLPREGGRSFLYLLCPPTPCPDPGLAGSSFASSDLLSAHSPRPMTPTAVRRTEFVPQAIPPSSRSGDQSPLPWASQVEWPSSKESTCQCTSGRRCGVDSLGQEDALE